MSKARPTRSAMPTKDMVEAHRVMSFLIYWAQAETLRDAVLEAHEPLEAHDAATIQQELAAEVKEMSLGPQARFGALVPLYFGALATAVKAWQRFDLHDEVIDAMIGSPDDDVRRLLRDTRDQAYHADPVTLELFLRGLLAVQFVGPWSEDLLKEWRRWGREWHAAHPTGGTTT